MKLNTRERLLIVIFKGYAKLPYRVIYYWGMGVGFLLAYLPIKLRRIIRLNLRTCFPEVDVNHMQKLQRQAMQHTIVRVMEMPYFWFASQANINRLIQCVRGQEILEQACTDKKSLLLMHPHHGAWEILNYYVGSRYPLSVLYKPPKGDFQEFIVKQAREKTEKTQMYPVSVQGVRLMLKDMKQGKFLGISPDHNPPDQFGVMSRFFGVKTISITLANQFANKHQLPAYLITAIRLHAGRGFAIELIPVNNPDFYDKDKSKAALALNQCIEQLVRGNIAQYEWSYRRFGCTPGFYD